jgi:hypothetical protein
LFDVTLILRLLDVGHSLAEPGRWNSDQLWTKVRKDRTRIGHNQSSRHVLKTRWVELAAL